MIAPDENRPDAIEQLRLAAAAQETGIVLHNAIEMARALEAAGLLNDRELADFADRVRLHFALVELGYGRTGAARAFLARVGELMFGLDAETARAEADSHPPHIIEERVVTLARQLIPEGPRKSPEQDNARLN